MRLASNRLEWMLVGTSVLAMAAAWLFTYWSIVDDRELTRSANMRITDSLAVSLEEHLGVTLTDARNSSYSTAVLIENAGGFAGFPGADALHKELQRELHDHAATARLIAVDERGRIRASSSEYPVPEVSFAQHGPFLWHMSHPADRGFHLGVPYRSPVGGTMVIPCSRAVFDRRGGIAGVVVAELRAEYLAGVYAALSGSIQASTVVFNHDGIILMRVPYDERRLGRSATSMAEFRKMLEANGNTEFKSAFDGKTRYYSHRVMRRDPALIAVGIDRDEVMAPSLKRARHRLAVMAAATLIFVALVSLLVADLRRLARGEERLRAVSQRLMEVEAIERRNINRELHDRVAQNLSALQISLALLRMDLDRDTRPDSSRRLEDAQALIRATADQVRDVMADLRPAALDDLGLFAALRDHAATVAARLGIAIAVRGQDLEPRLPLSVESALFRIAQEALNNVALHAQARTVEIALAATPQAVRLSVTDDGVGFDSGHPPRRAAHYGIATMRERAEAAGARLRIESTRGKGTSVVLEVQRSAA